MSDQYSNNLKRMALACIFDKDLYLVVYDAVIQGTPTSQGKIPLKSLHTVISFAIAFLEDKKDN